MNKDLRAIVGILAIGVAAMASCKKKSNSTPASTLEGGAWTIEKSYLDTNHNGVMDANELFMDTSYAHTQLKFNADGTVVETYYGSIVHKGTWALENSNTYLQITDTSAGAKPSHSLIMTLTANSLVLKDTSNSSLSWTYLTR